MAGNGRLYQKVPIKDNNRQGRKNRDKEAKMTTTNCKNCREAIELVKGKVWNHKVFHNLNNCANPEPETEADRLRKTLTT
ncbi:MAG: hypothetical protein AABY22_37075 [Nanoarchaeota archaeon]